MGSQFSSDPVVSMIAVCMLLSLVVASLVALFTVDKWAKKRRGD